MLSTGVKLFNVNNIKTIDFMKIAMCQFYVNMYYLGI